MKLLVNKLLFLLCINYFLDITNSNNSTLTFPKENIILFGEDHFVNEKYKEILDITLGKMEKDTSISSLNLYLEMPHSFQYITDRLIFENDTQLFNRYFNNIYSSTKAASPFWNDFKALILNIYNYSKSKNIDLKIVCLDHERVYRRTIFSISNFLKNNDLKISKIDSLSNLKFIPNSKKVNSIIVRICKDIPSRINLTIEEAKFIKNIIYGLSIDCIMCLDRDKFMAKNFLNQYTGSEEILNIGSFGLVHLIPKKLPYIYKNPDNPFRPIIDSLKTFNPFINLLPDSIKDNAYIIAIQALYQSSPNYEIISVQKNVEGMSDEELAFVIQELKGLNRKAFNTKNYIELNSYSKNVDNLILYKKSNYK